MSLEQGLAVLVQSNSGVHSICPVGGFLVQLPANQPLPSWTHTTVSEPVDYVLSGAQSLRLRRTQIDCYGTTPSDAISLARAIDAVLINHKGALSEGTIVAGCFRSNQLDFFDSANTYRRMLEYQIWYYAS